MRYLVLSDIHSNLQALDAALAAAAEVGFDQVLFLGDLVGYAAEPNLVIDRLRELRPLAVVRGNHDKVCAGIESADSFNRVARQAALWTNVTLTADNRAYLASLPAGPAFVGSQIEICHGTPADEDGYVVNQFEARDAIAQSERPWCLFGHTHIPCGFTLANSSFALVLRAARGGETLRLEPGVKYLLNPGSIGQPRDGDPRAAFLILDDTAAVATWYRTMYDVETAQLRILEAHLPTGLADRLAIGR